VQKIAVLSGPGVQPVAEFLAAAANLPLISVGNMFREHLQRQTPMGLRIDQYMRAGDLVPDELTVEFVTDALATAGGGWLLHNFPRSVRQAELLAQHGHQPDAVIELVTSQDEFEVVTRREVELGLKPAGLLEVMSIRYAIYRREGEPLRDYYRARGLYSTVSGSGTPEDVAARLIAAASGG